MSASTSNCGNWHRWLTTAHIAVSAIIYIVLAVIAAFAKSQAGEEFFIMMMWGLFSAISVSAAKLIYMPFYAISMLPRLRQSRAMRKWRIAGIAIGAAVLLTMWWGAIVTPRQLEVNNVTITSANLPAAFDGYRIPKCPTFTPAPTATAHQSWRAS